MSFNLVTDLYSRWKHLGREVKHSPRSIAEVKNKCTLRVPPLYAFMAWSGKNFTFLQNALIPAVKD